MTLAYRQRRHGENVAESSYTLLRRWEPANLIVVAFIGLNPSTADETLDDPTIRRCIGFAKAWGAGGMYMLNLFGWRSTDPAGLAAAEDPVGPENDAAIDRVLAREGPAAFAVACWGAHPSAKERGKVVADRIARLRHVSCFGLTASGAPKHPLYLAKTTTLVTYVGGAR